MKPNILTRHTNQHMAQDLRDHGISPLLAQLYASRDIHNTNETNVFPT